MARWMALGLVLCVAIWWWQGRTVGATDGGKTEIAALAASVRADEVIVYTTSTCNYGAEAMRWLDQQGFAYTVCNMSTTARCEQTFLASGATGTPYLIVRGHHMKDGFDSDEFLAALR